MRLRILHSISYVERYETLWSDESVTLVPVNDNYYVLHVDWLGTVLMFSLIHIGLMERRIRHSSTYYVSCVSQLLIMKRFSIINFFLISLMERRIRHSTSNVYVTIITRSLMRRRILHSIAYVERYRLWSLYLLMSSYGSTNSSL